MVRKRPSQTTTTRHTAVSLPLSKEVLAAAYDYLVTTQPFVRWNLPESEEITFKVTRHTDRHAHHRMVNSKHEVAVSTKYIGRTLSLMEVMAHEMIHLYQRESKSETSSDHNAAFHRYAVMVCRYHGFDPKTF